ncbi:MAG: VWA domain-containing protein [Chitinivibrionales bacterium]|nr:VWA domain-containing protein [Chitinivibrionales bacterium]
MRKTIMLFMFFVATVSRAAINPDSLGEGACVGLVPHPADTVRDTSFHPGDTLILSGGEMLIKPFPEERREAAIPSVKTVVRIIAGDGFAHGRVEQTFHNPFELPFEATYIFPLPHDGAVHAMDFRTSTGVFHADLLEKEEAKQKYEEAKQEGRQAALLMQGQDNIFVQKLCNILPHDSVKVTITFSMALTYDMGIYEIAFPTVVGPRYDPAALPKRLSNPAYLPPDIRSGSSLDFSVLILTPYAVDQIDCPQHEVAVDGGNLEATLQNIGMLEPGSQLPQGANPSLVRLVAKETIPNRDIGIRFKRKDTGRDLSVLSWHDGSQGYFAMNIYPDLIDTSAEADKPIDMVFVIDISGSMWDKPLKQVKAVMNAMLDKARPVDRLSFIAFNNSATNFHETPIAATPENVAAARTWINGLQASGGTQMIDGARKGLSVPLDAGRLRVMSLLTDGYIGDVDGIYREIANDPAGTICFTFGIGTSVNRELIDAAATAGNGMAKVVLLNDDPHQLVDEFWTRIRSPQLSDIVIDWGGDVAELTIGDIPCLWLGQPVRVFGKYRTGGSRTLTLTANKEGTAVTETYPAYFVSHNTLLNSVPEMWARETIENLRNDQIASGDEHNKDAILALSLEHEVLCAYTAFLAVADSVVNENGEMVASEVPAPVPEGVDPYMSAAYERYYATSGQYIMLKVDSSANLPVKKELAAESKSPEVIIAPADNSLAISLENMDKLAEGSVRICDIKGRIIYTWTLQELASRGFSLQWNYRDMRGKRVSKGFYIIVVQTLRHELKIPFMYR